MLCGLALATQASGLGLGGRVLDASGEPARAYVVVGCQPEAPVEPYEALAEARAGEDGRFALELPRTWIERSSGYRELDVFAYLEGHGIATVHWSVADIPAGSQIELRLPVAAAARMRFVDAQGRPVASALVWPKGLARSGRGEFRMPDPWWRRHAAVTDEEGWATLPVSPAELRRVGFEADGFGSQDIAPHWPFVGPLPSELEVLPPVRRVVRVDGPVPAGTMLQVDVLGLRELEGGVKYAVHLERRSAVTGGAPVEVLGEEQLVNVRLTTADASALEFGPVAPDEGTDPAAAGSWRLSRQETYRVRGRVVDESDGRPVPGARIRVRALHQGWVETGPDGVFELACAAPWVALDTLLAPAGFASVPFLEHPTVRKPETGGDVDLGDVKVARTWTATGRVITRDRRPVAGAWVVGQQLVTRGRVTDTVTVSGLSDGDGRYALHGAIEGLTLHVSARLGDATADATQAEGSELELVFAPSLRARGTAKRPDGAPLSGLELEVWRASPDNVIGGEKRVSLGGRDSFGSGEDGTFESAGGLDPEELYCVAWSGAAVESGRSEWITGARLTAGIEIEARPLVTARGTIRSADGRPIAGATVRTRRGRIEAATDENGEFELAGVSPDGDVLIVRDESGAPHVRPVPPADGTLDWRLAPHASRERPLAPAPEHDRVRELELAVELLEQELRDAVESGEERAILAATQRLAWADPAGTLDRVDKGLFSTAWMRDAALAYVAGALLPDSPREAMVVGARLERGLTRSRLLLDAAERLDPAAEREQLALIRAQARAIDPPEHRVVVLARLADRLLDLGEADTAKEVLEEGRKLAAELPAHEWPGYARSRFGEVLSRVDAAAGRKLIDELSNVGDRPRHVFNTAHELAASDPAAAQALVEAQAKSRSSMWNVDRFVSRIAHRMAPADLARARELARRHDPSGFSDGMIALALAESDPEEARKSLELAFERAEKVPWPGWAERPVRCAAALLPVAERVDPGRLRAYVARALALRRPAPAEGLRGEAVVWRDDAALAFYVARWDRELARELLEPAVEAARRIRVEELRDEYDAAWAAAAVVDPTWAAQLGRDLGGRARSVIGLVLALPPSFRTTYVQDELLGLWVVGKEDL